jgi:hypothetical protein
MNAKSKWILISSLFLAVLVGLIWSGRLGIPVKHKKSQATVVSSGKAPASASNGQSAAAKLKQDREERLAREQLSDQEAVAQGLPRGTYKYLYDKAPHANRFLIAKGRDTKYLEHSDAPSGMDLWVQDEDGKERLINGSVTRAKFSPDANKIAYTTSDCLLHVEDLHGGGALATVEGVYGASWRPDGNAVVFSKVGEGQDLHQAGTRQLTAIDLATREMKPLSDGRFDDGRPEFSPGSDWVLFVSGARSGLASFWKVPTAGGEPVQLTNIELAEVNEKFVPTPYERTIWSGDKRWFLYDFKAGERQETWGLEFNANGTVKQAAKLANGINPRWKEDGRTFVCEKETDGSIQTIVSNLP